MSNQSKKNIVFAVINELNSDQRMQRTCNSLLNNGFHVTLIGKYHADSAPLINKPFKQIRLFLFFTRGKLYYLEYNIKLFIKLLFIKCDIIGAIDLDGMLASYLAAKIRGKILTYDAHEYFTELPEIVERPITKKMWQWIEKKCLPSAKIAYTINDCYAKLYEKNYLQKFEIIRNATVLEDKIFPTTTGNYILYQGAVNVGRGVEEMILAMNELHYKLIICGKGDQLEYCKELVRTNKLESKVEFKGFVEPNELKKITIEAKIGFTLFSNKGFSYYYSLANRFFDYMHNAVPQIAVDFPEYRAINERFEIAILVSDIEVTTLINAVNRLLYEPGLYDRLRSNCMNARLHYNWQNEEIKLIKLYNTIE